MKTYRMNAVMAGALYFLGTVFGVTGAIIGGEVLSSIVSAKPLAGVDILARAATDSSQLTAGAFFTLLMGLSLAAMTVFLFPIFRKDSEELALSMLIFRGAIEGAGYIFMTLNLLTLIAVANEYVAAGADSAALASMGNVFYHYADFIGPVHSITFLIGATCLYISFYRTRLIPRWLSVWGLIGVIPYLAYALLHFFHMDHGIGFWLQMLLAPQEIVMGLWLVIAGFNQDAVKKLG